MVSGAVFRTGGTLYRINLLDLMYAKVGGINISNWVGSHRACDKLYFNGTQRYLKPAPSEISNFRDAYQPKGRRYESFSGTFSTTDDITSFLLSDSVIEADGGAALRQTEYQTPGKTTGIPPSSQYS